jgi:hypothetical protein
VRSAQGWHAWLWQIRLVQVLAELASARQDWSGTMEHATKGILQSHARYRKKYEILGLVTRARARMKLNERDAAVEDSGAALNLARQLRDPVVLVEPCPRVCRLTEMICCWPKRETRSRQ